MRLQTLVLGAVLVIPAGPPQERSETRRPNVVLIVADDLGYGDLGSYGAPDARTPHLDRLAREGVRFTDFYANAPVCTPTRAALLTGRYQQRVLLERPLSTGDKEHRDLGLPVTGRSLPQLLKHAGYATALIGKWHLGFRPEFHPNRHGFDYFWGFLAGYVDWYTHVNGSGEPDLYENGTPVRHTGYLGHEVTRRAERFIEDHAKAPFFLEVAYGEPHWPFQSPHHPSVAVRRHDSMMQFPADDNVPARRDYVEILQTADAGIGRILEALDRLGLAANTLVIFVSDNGGEWLSRNAPLFHRKDSLWEGGIRVPALFRWPGVMPAGAVSPQVGITMDLTHTILAAAGAAIPSDARLEGIDLLPVLRGASPEVERTLFWRNPVPGREQRAVRSGDWKLIMDGSRNVQLLFNVRADPGERHDLAGDRPDLVRTLKAAFEEWEAEVDREAGSVADKSGGNHSVVRDEIRIERVCRLCSSPNARLLVGNRHLLRQRRQRGVGRPQPQPAHKRRRQEMRIDPADATTVQFPLAHERDHFGVRHHGRLIHSLVVRQQLLAPTWIADQELPVNEIMASHVVLTQEVVQISRIRRPV